MNFHPSPVPHAIPDFSEMNLALKVARSASAGYFVDNVSHDPAQW
jgi:hypothetical protein